MFDRYTLKSYRPDIQGLRAVSALMIMVYHIWLGKVSGGVDVFFAISGYLIGGQLLRLYAEEGRIRSVRFWSRLALRIFPSAYFVLFATAVLTLLIVPPPIWKYGLIELVASSLHVINWELVRTATNYLARDNPPSQYQQFWALSIQIQFYLIVPFLIALLAFVARRTRSVAAMTWVVLALMLVSFGYSVIETVRSPATAYFNTGTRLWELLAGVALATVAPSLATMAKGTIPAPIAKTIYLGAVVAFIALGAVLPSTVSFPGWIALIPVTLVLSFIVVGGQIDQFFLKRFLSSKPMTAAGELSFTVYLWHWPILVLFHHWLGHTHLGLGAGLLVMAFAIGAAWCTNRFVERPLLRKRDGSAWRGLALAVSIALPVILTGLGLYATMQYFARRPLPGPTAPIVAIAEPQRTVDLSLRTFAMSNYDRPRAITNCLGRPICTFGPTDGRLKVALVGASHAAQWQPAVERMANARGFRVDTVLSKSREATRAAIERIKPDIVITTSTLTSMDFAPERIEAESIAFWKWLSARGIRIIAIRDNARFKTYQNACLWRHRSDATACALKRSDVYGAPYPAKPLERVIPGFHAVDLSDLYCSRDLCPAINQDNLIYYDRNHFTASYVTRMAPAALRMIEEQAGAPFTP